MKNRNRKYLNLILLLLVILAAGWDAWFLWRPSSSGSLPTSLQSPVSSAVNTVTRPRAESPIVGEQADSLLQNDIKQFDSPAPPALPAHNRTVTKTSLPTRDLRSLPLSNPFREEARKILEGRLEESDSLNRGMIINYCEHLRSAYTTKDLDFIRQLLSDNALIIVGHTVRTAEHRAPDSFAGHVRYSLLSKPEYLQRLEKVFAANEKIDVRFSDFSIMRHPTMEGIYGVTLRQQYSSDRYSDDGWLFLLWDFRNPSMPKIHVRTWQPRASMAPGEDLIDISDFNLE